MQEIKKMGWDKPEKNQGCNGISIISPTHPKAKNYYAIDTLAFKVWRKMGRKSGDEDYEKWLGKNI